MVGAQQMRQRWLEQLLIEVILLRGVPHRKWRDKGHGEEYGQYHQTSNGASVATKAAPHQASVPAIISPNGSHSHVMNTRVDHAVQQVDAQVDQDEERREGQHDALDDRIVACEQGVD